MREKPIHEVDCKTENFCAVGGVLVQVVVLAHVQHPPRHLLPHVRLHLHLDVLEVVGVDRGVSLLVPQKVLQDPIVFEQDQVAVCLDRGVVEAVRVGGFAGLKLHRFLQFSFVDHLRAEQVTGAAHCGSEKFWRGVLAVRVVGDVPILWGDRQTLRGEQDSIGHPCNFTQLCQAC